MVSRVLLLSRRRSVNFGNETRKPFLRSPQNQISNAISQYRSNRARVMEFRKKISLCISRRSNREERNSLESCRSRFYAFALSFAKNMLIKQSNKRLSRKHRNFPLSRVTRKIIKKKSILALYTHAVQQITHKHSFEGRPRRERAWAIKTYFVTNE